MKQKTAAILIHLDPDTKEQADEIMRKLGIPASIVINMLYKQIIMTRGIPFSLSVPCDVEGIAMVNAVLDEPNSEL